MDRALAVAATAGAVALAWMGIYFFAFHPRAGYRKERMAQNGPEGMRRARSFVRLIGVIVVLAVALGMWYLTGLHRPSN
jgi:hypothetical protein